MEMADSSGIPLVVHIASAAPNDVALVRILTLQRVFLQARRQQLIVDERITLKRLIANVNKMVSK
jgi:hypothetical protein